MSPVLLGLMIAIAIVFIALVFTIISYFMNSRDDNNTEDYDEEVVDDDLVVITYDEDMTYDSSELPNNILQSVVGFNHDAQDVICSLINEFVIGNGYEMYEVAILDVNVPDNSEVGEIKLICHNTEMTIRVAVTKGVRAGYMIYEFVEDEEDE